MLPLACLWTKNIYQSVYQSIYRLIYDHQIIIIICGEPWLDNIRSPVLLQHAPEPCGEVRRQAPDGVRTTSRRHWSCAVPGETTWGSNGFVSKGDTAEMGSHDPDCRKRFKDESHTSGTTPTSPAQHSEMRAFKCNDDSSWIFCVVRVDV